MSRSFPFSYQGRSLNISAVAIDEGWELWIFEGGHKLTCVGSVSIDEAIAAGRQGEDRILALAEQARINILSARIPLRSRGQLA